MVKMQLTIVNNFIIGSSRGRTFGFGPNNGGSNPSPITFGYPKYCSYLYIIKMINKEKKVMDKLQEIKVTQQEWNDALRVPTPHRNKKKYYRKDKHKNSWRS